MNPTTEQVLKIGSRQSELAQAQAQLVMAALKRVNPGLRFELITMKTQGDRLLDQSLQSAGGKGLFVKELQTALMDRVVDLVIHSAKDLPAESPPGLTLASVLKRDDARDVLVHPAHLGLHQLPDHARIGTASVRRTAQLLRVRPGSNICLLRGNVQTRLRKLHAGELDAMVLAAAGLHRLNLQACITEYLDPLEDHLPAVCQGILAAEFRLGDERVRQWVAQIQDPMVEAAFCAEREALIAMEGSCQLPMGVHAFPQGLPQEAIHPHEPVFTLKGQLLSLNGQDKVSASLTFSMHSAREAGLSLAQKLLGSGGLAIRQALLLR
jgi:hydroxymethylbilane synthase